MTAVGLQECDDVALSVCFAKGCFIGEEPWSPRLRSARVDVLELSEADQESSLTDFETRVKK